MKIKTIKIAYPVAETLQSPPSTKPSPIKALTKVSFTLEIAYDEGEPPASKVNFKIFARPKGSQGEYINVKEGSSQLTGNTVSFESGFEENFAGAELAISFGLNTPYKPPFKDASGNLVGTVKYITVESNEQGAPKVKSVLWSTEEKIQFGKINPARETICRNEDGFLHIHTRGMYGQKVKVEIYEHDRTGSPALLKSYENQLISDNVLYFPVEMSEIGRKAENIRSTWAEGDNFDLLAKVTPLNRSISSQQSGMIYLSIEKQTVSKIAKATVNGVSKFVIGGADEGKETGGNCGGKHCITRANYKEKKAEKLIEEISIRLAGFGGNVPSQEFTERTEKTIKQFQRDYMGVAETGKICGGLLKAIDEFCSKVEYDFNFDQTKCTCVSGNYKSQYNDLPLCSGYGTGKTGYKIGGKWSAGVEYPGIHRSLLFVLKGLIFYMKGTEYSLNCIYSSYRCWVDNVRNSRTSTNHMGCALDLHINKNGGRTSSVSDMEKIRKNFFCEYMNAPYDKKDGGQTYNFGWKKNYVGLEPKKFNNGDEGATSWVHVDIREFETTYKASHFYIKSKSDLAKKSISDFAKDIGLKDLCLCNGK